LIVVDSSVLIAILRGEPDSERYLRTLVSRRPVLLSAMTFLEASMVLCGREPEGDESWRELDTLLARLRADIVPHDAALARIAREAFLRFGKGRHPAGLNLGDCASYALAKARGLPLLFKGEDFSKTDLVSPPS
jgi:ribonuclease VapC